MVIRDEHAGTQGETWKMRRWVDGGETVVQESDAEWLVGVPEQPVHNRRQRRALARENRRSGR